MTTFKDKTLVQIKVEPEEAILYDKIYFAVRNSYPDKRVSKNDIFSYALRSGMLIFEDKTKESIDVILQNKASKNR